MFHCSVSKHETCLVALGIKRQLKVLGYLFCTTMFM